MIKILALGDLVGRPGRDILVERLPALLSSTGATFVVLNAENAAGGSGLTPEIASALFAAGVDCLTTGDHVFKRKEIVPVLETDQRVLRPANFPPEASGKGVTVLADRNGKRVGVINLLGRVFINRPVDCPFRVVDELLSRLIDETDAVIVDMHAEATSEKLAMGWYLDGRVSGVVGTHTHVATADERVLPGGTAYITDLGMTGPHDSILGRDKDRVLRALTTGMPAHFDVAEGDRRINGVLITVNPETGLATDIQRVSVGDND